ncbi:Uncharacterised protein [Mycobacteroides abscessus subsp. abscessus]|uniref:hypothetical protein n=1 Tax=Mycobacteroides abscessus TaxID=36809 RepID=UPI00092B1509|nr:hypothetical protein [Mycobacteroides abscessus]SHS19059.1 Uncharacterised protein [Mycobacteroides abscessus subsp. abscessus]
MSNDDPWICEPGEYVATYDQAVRNMVWTQVEPTVRLAGGFDAVRADPAHPIHQVYDDLGSLERDYETIVSRALDELTSAHYEIDPQYGVVLTAQAHEVIDRHVRVVRETKPILHYRDDPSFDRNNPDELNPHHPHELDPSVYIETRAQALRFDVLHEIAPDIAGAGGFPGVARNPNHRRHNSAEGLAKVRQQYDSIVERAERTFSNDAYYHDAEYGWGLRAFAIYELKQIATVVRKLTPAELAAEQQTRMAAHAMIPAIPEGQLRINSAHSPIAAQRNPTAEASVRPANDEIRRFLVDQRLGMRPAAYLCALAATAGTGAALQQAAHNELARREALSAEDHAAEDAIRAREQEAHSRTRDRSLIGSDMSL